MLCRCLPSALMQQQPRQALHFPFTAPESGVLELAVCNLPGCGWIGVVSMRLSRLPAALAGPWPAPCQGT